MQSGRGSSYETVQKQRSTGKDLVFEFSTAINRTSRDPDFSGPVVQGKTGERFVYIDIGRYAGQTDTECARRLKVPLSGVMPGKIEAGTRLEAVIPGVSPDGQPTCAYIWRKQVGAGWAWKASDGKRRVRRK